MGYAFDCHCPAGKVAGQLHAQSGKRIALYTTYDTLTPRIASNSRNGSVPKTVSSRLLHRDYGAHLARHYRKPVLWSPWYCLISCGGAPLEVIKQYIQNQAGAD
jgi:hypothetical protein